MPYFIYKISPNEPFAPVTSFNKFIDAKKEVRGLRAALTATDAHTFRIIFAGDTLEAERLLREKREPRPEGEEQGKPGRAGVKEDPTDRPAQSAHHPHR